MSQFEQAFGRYAAFTDLHCLIEASSKPLRRSLRVNTLKCSVPDLLAWGKAKNWSLEPVPWCVEGFYIDRVDREEALGKDVLHLLGDFYLQEAASMLPVTLLDPRPGETVLDMSAAPGSKTTQIAARMEGKGVIIANDVQEKRIWSLLSNLQRCGVINAVVTRKVGQWFAGNMTERFDRVLCDAPCTAQGTVRKDSDALRYASQDNIGKMAKLQRELLESAVHSCKVGGRIVYSTCTLTPEENEDVVLSILSKYPEQLVVLDPRKDMRLGTWDLSKAVEDSVRVQRVMKSEDSHLTSHISCLRIWPQTFDTEGFFCAVLRKRAPTRDPKRSEDIVQWPTLPKSKIRESRETLSALYGSSFLRDTEVLTEMKAELSVLPEEVLHFPLSVKPYYAGFSFGKATNQGLLRLSHEMATLRGGEATKQVLTVSEEDFRKMIRGVNVEIKNPEVNDGDVLLALEVPPLKKKLVFGRGLLKNGVLLNRLPRDMVRMFT